ncbi:MAG TPA: hypothetical protein VLW06_14210 [Terriglobales bacterium]|nr:hypothetical protein [Terriglobales bacterium]
MKVALIVGTGALALIAILQFSSGEWIWPTQRHATTIDSVYRNRHRPPPRTPRNELQVQQAQRRDAAAVQSAIPQDVIPGTPDRVYELPSVYAHHHVMLDEWKIGWLRKIPSSQFPPDALARKISDCDWYLGFSINAGACMSSGEIERVKQMAREQQNVWGLPNADLLCYVEAARFSEGFLLTHCRAVPIPIDVEISRENQRQREQELQNILRDLGN